MTNESFIMLFGLILLAISSLADAKATLSHSADDPAGTIRVTLLSECALHGVTNQSFVPGAMGEHMFAVPGSFESSDDMRRFSCVMDVSNVPLGEVASIGFSSYGVVDSCTNEMLALVDPLLFRLSSGSG